MVSSRLPRRVCGNARSDALEATPSGRRYSMRIAFLCGFRRGLACFQKLLEMQADLRCVFVYPEDPHEVPCWPAICNLAKERGIPCYKTRNVAAPEYQTVWEEAKPDLALVIGWRSMISNGILERPPLGVVGIHDSLLPKYRGFAPTN